MDISSVKQTDTATLTILHPMTDEPMVTDDGKEMTITVYGPHSTQYRKAIFQQRRQIMDAGEDADASDAMATELLADVTADWVIQDGGKAVKCTRSAAVRLYSELRWLRDQVDRFVHARANFINGTSSG